MNEKGQIGVGLIILVAVAIIVGLVILQESANTISTITTTVTYANQTYTSGAIGSSVTLRGQANTNLIVQLTSGTLIPASNYTVTNYVVSNGQLISTLTSNAGAGGWQGKGINVTSTVEPFGYDTNSGSRAVINLVILFFALGIAVIAMTPLFREKLIDLVT